MIDSGHIQNLRVRAADMLLRAADTQERGELWSLDDQFESFETELASGESPEDLETIKEFCNGWADARNHDWQFYEPLIATDWPRLAREIAADLVAGRTISSPEVQRQFGPAIRRAGNRGCLGTLVAITSGG